MTDEQRKMLRQTLAITVLGIQEHARAQCLTVEDVIPEIMAALLSLAAYTANHANATTEQFMLAAKEASREVRRI